MYFVFFPRYIQRVRNFKSATLFCVWGYNIDLHVHVGISMCALAVLKLTEWAGMCWDERRAPPVPVVSSSFYIDSEDSMCLQGKVPYWQSHFPSPNSNSPFFWFCFWDKNIIMWDSRWLGTCSPPSQLPESWENKHTELTFNCFLIENPPVALDFLWCV